MAEEEQAAAEYVLGTLPPDERRAFLLRLAREPGLVEEVARWQERLAPLALTLAGQAPPAALWSRIEASIAPPPVRAATGWRTMAIAASLVAAAFGALLARRTLVPPDAPAGATMLATLNAAGEAPGLIVRYDRATDRVTLLPVNLPAESEHSLEVWAVRGQAAPEPMWLLDPAKPLEQHDARGRVAENIVFAVSREPRGGSILGRPSGPILYTGRLRAMPDD